MKRVYFYIGAIVGIIFVVLFFFTINPKKVEMENEKLVEMENEKLELLQQHLEEIEKGVIDLTSPSDLKRVKAFNLLLDAHKDTVDISLMCQYLGDESKSDIHKEILIYSLDEARADSYAKVFECCVDLYKKKKVDKYLIWTIVLPVPDDFWNCVLAKNYRDERLRKIIIENKKKLPAEMEEVLDLLLSGILWESIEEERELYREHNNAQHY